MGVAHAQPRSYRSGEVQTGRIEAEAPFIDLYTFERGAVTSSVKSGSSEDDRLQP